MAPSVPSASQAAAQNQQQAPYPSLHLYPLNNSFAPKAISLDPPGSRVKIGRQTNAKTLPTERNGYFDSKVLSRAHAEVFAEGGKIYIKDVKSSNGTFINGERLSPEGVESDVFELHSEDMVEFGIDIVGDDNKTIIHHKVAAKVFVVLSPEDAAISQREAVYYRSAAAAQQQHDMGSQRRMGGGKSVNLDHILNRLQNELQKSRETGAELHSLTGQMTDIQDTLGGGLPPHPTFPPHHLPPVRAPNQNGGSPPQPHDSTIASLQQQLTDTQASLTAQVEKIRSLEGLLSEHELIKREVGAMRSEMEESRRWRGSSGPRGGERGRRRGRAAGFEEEEYEIDEDDDDARSVVTITAESHGDEPGAGDRFQGDEEDEAERQRAREELRPRTPEPTANADEDDDELRRELERRRQLEDSASSSESAPPAPAPEPADLGPSTSELASQNAALSSRLSTLSAELSTALDLSRTLQAQHAEASATIRALEEKVSALEREVEGRVREAESRVLKELEGRWQGWKEKWEEGWKREREGWDGERDKLRKLIREWEEASRRAEEEDEDRSLNSSDSDDSDASDDDQAPGVLSPPHSIASSSTSPDGSLVDAGSAPSLAPPSSSKRRSLRRRSFGDEKRLNPALRQFLRGSSALSDEQHPEDDVTPRGSRHGSERSLRRVAKRAGSAEPAAASAAAAGGDGVKSPATRSEGSATVRGVEVDFAAERQHSRNRSGTVTQARNGGGRGGGSGDHTLQYASAVGVVMIGVAAWTVLQKARE